jgi:hypothetical protein
MIRGWAATYIEQIRSYFLTKMIWPQQDFNECLKDSPIFRNYKLLYLNPLYIYKILYILYIMLKNVALNNIYYKNNALKIIFMEFFMFI